MANNLLLRTLSAVVLGAASIYCIMSGWVAFVFLMLIALTLMLYEWFSINKNKNSFLYIFGNIYLIIPMIYWILECDKNKEICVISIMWIFGIVWTCDIFAFIGGKLLKGPKFAPSISPNKTWSGVTVGSVFSLLFSYYYISHFFIIKFSIIIISSVLLISGSILGDLLESKIKRVLGVKDTGNIIPGHGGVCDRLDSFLLTTYVFMLLHIH